LKPLSMIHIMLLRVMISVNIKVHLRKIDQKEEDFDMAKQ